MQIDSAQSLIDVLRTSGLFTRERFAQVVQELSRPSGDFQSLLKHVVSCNFLTVYQVRKVIHGKAHELFVGPYVIKEKIGEGGMGRVYRATQVRLDREVALKVVRSSLLGNQLVRKRYEREVQTASSLVHPNVVRVIDAGEAEGKYYLAMEYVDGIDLSRLIRECRPLEIPEACEYARQAALGLQYAHEQGFVHRDIKPSNIIVSGERHVPQATEPCVVKILDMGLVRSVGFDDGGGGGDLTRAGTVVGTPDYMAPEQAKNSSAVDHRADLYSLGCALYYLIAGQPPFPTGTAIEKLLKHQLEAPVPLQALRPETPTRVAEVIARLIAKQPDRRYQSAAEAAEQLAPLTLYTAVPEDPQPSRARAMIEPLVGKQSLASDSVLLTAGPSSSLNQEPEPPGPRPSAEPIAPSERTPRPKGFPAGLPQPAESNTPFDDFAELKAAPVRAAPRPKTPAPGQPPSYRVAVWIAAAMLAAILVIGLVVWVAGPGGKKKTELTPEINAGTPNEATARANSRTESIPIKEWRSSHCGLEART